MMGCENNGEEAHRSLSDEKTASAVPLQDPSPQSNGSNSFVDHPLSSSLQFVEIPTNEDDIFPPQTLMHALSPRDRSIHSILEPPSYAEAVFRSFDLDFTESSYNTEMDQSGILSQPLTSDYLRISVSDPQTQQELTSSLVSGGGTYVSYLITTFTNLPEFNGSEFNVRRRFRDVVSLSDGLAENYRGYFIPLRPDKSVLESQVMQKSEFIEQRRMLLEKYLSRLASHPVIRRSEELRVFLQDSGKICGGESLAKGAIGTGEVSQPAKGGGLLKMFKDFKQTISNDWVGVKPPVIEEDKEFLESKEKLQTLEQQLSNVSQQAEYLVKAQQDIGETMGQLGLAFVKLTKFETDEGVYNSQTANAEDLKNVATAAVKASRLYRELNSQTVKHLDKLHEYLGVMLAASNALSERSSALLTVQTLLSDLASLNSRVEKLEAASSRVFGGDTSRNRRIEELRETIRLTETAKDCAQQDYERINENNRSELARVEEERHDDFVSMLKGFIVNQAGYAEKMGNVWETVAQQSSKYVK